MFLNFKNLLNDHEDERIKKFVDRAMWVQNVLATPSLFKHFTNFTLIEFEKLTSQIMSIISSHARSAMKRDLSR
jgi:hypothetical protein